MVEKMEEKVALACSIHPCYPIVWLGTQTLQPVVVATS